MEGCKLEDSSLVPSSVACLLLLLGYLTAFGNIVPTRTSRYASGNVPEDFFHEFPDRCIEQDIIRCALLGIEYAVIKAIYNPKFLGPCVFRPVFFPEAFLVLVACFLGKICWRPVEDYLREERRRRALERSRANNVFFERDVDSDPDSGYYSSDDDN